MSSVDGLRADIVWQANTGTAIAELGEVGHVYRQTTGAMSDEALRLAVAQERLNKVIARSGPESTSAKSATLAYRREVQALAREEQVAAGAAARANAEHLSLSRTRRSSLAQEERSAGRFGRGALSGSGLLSGIGGRALAFGSTAFIGGTGLVFAIRAATEAAKDHQVTEGQLAAALHAAGLSYHQYGSEIDETLGKQRALTGFTEEETARSFIRLVRTTRDVGSALRYNAEAADIARGANIGLDAASKIVVKALAGQTTGLRRLGVDLPKGVTGYRALQIAQQKFAGSSEAYSKTAAGAQARLNQSIHQTEVTIGTALLPTITRLSGRLATWLSASRNQQKIQRDVNSAIHTGAQVVHGLEGAYRVLSPIVRVVNGALGGTRHSVELLTIALVGLKLRSLATDFGLLKVATVEAGAAAAVSAGEYGALAGAEAEAAAAGGAGAGAFGVARGAARTAVRGGLVLAAPLLILNALQGKEIPAYTDPKTGAQVSLDPKTGAFYKSYPGKPRVKIDPAGDLAAAARAYYERHGLRSKAPNTSGMSNDPLHDAADRGPTETASERRPPKPSPLDRLTRINLAVSAAQTAVARGDKGAQEQLVRALKDEIDYDRHYEQVQERLIKTDVAHRAQHAKILQGLQGDEQSALGQIASIEGERAQAVKAAADKEAAARKKRHDAEKAAAAKRKRDEEAALQEKAKLLRDGYALRERELHNATLRARLTTYTLTDDRKAYAAEIAFDKAREHDVKLTKIERESYVAKELADRKALQDLDKKKTTTDGGWRAEQTQFLADFQRIRGAYESNATTVPQISTGKMETHLYEAVHELRQQTHAVRQLTGRTSFPASGYAIASAQALFG